MLNNHVIKRYVNIGNTKFFERNHKLLIIPFGKENYIYYEHPTNLINFDKRIVRIDNWINSKSAKIWLKFSNSKSKVNQYLHGKVTILMNKIPWEEDCFRSFPMETHIIAHKKQELIEIYSPYNDIDTIKVRISTKLGILEPQYKKQILYCLLGLPLTLPIALVPLVPNIPGFYLLYRLYCNYKALHGLRHFRKLINNHNYKYIRLTDMPKVSIEAKNESTKLISEYTKIPQLESRLKRALDQTT